jgi:hypothetical protein
MRKRRRVGVTRRVGVRRVGVTPVRLPDVDFKKSVIVVVEGVSECVCASMAVSISVCARWSSVHVTCCVRRAPRAASRPRTRRAATEAAVVVIVDTIVVATAVVNAADVVIIVVDGIIVVVCSAQ